LHNKSSKKDTKASTCNLITSQKKKSKYFKVAKYVLSQKKNLQGLAFNKND
jgi:hypothetical protein